MTSPKKILILSQYFWPEEFLVNDFAKGLRQKGYDIEVLTGLPNYPSGKFSEGYSFSGPYKEEIDGNTVYRSPLIPRGKANGIRLTLNYASFVIFSTIRGLISCRKRYDCILVFQLSPVTVGVTGRFLKWLTGARLCMWVQDLWPESLSASGGTRNPKVLSTVGKVTSWIYAGCDAIMVQSQAFRPSIIHYGGTEAKIHYFPNWADSFFTPNTKPTMDVDFPKGFRIMFAGNIGASQDFETIASAAEITLLKRPDIQWIIVGDGRHRQWLEKEVNQRKLTNLHLLGRHPKEAMPGFFCSADVMLVSLKDEPIFSLTIPSKIQAYFACGKPVLASLNGEGARIIMDANAGLAVQAERPEELASAAIKLANMPPDKLKEIGQNAINYSKKNFTLKCNIANFETLMQKLT